jgi:phage gp29-like protein
MKTPQQASLPLQSDNQDTRLNVRVDPLLKAQFEALCKESYTTVSGELKRFMVRCVKAGKLL